MRLTNSLFLTGLHCHKLLWSHAKNEEIDIPTTHQIREPENDLFIEIARSTLSGEYASETQVSFSFEDYAITVDCIGRQGDQTDIFLMFPTSRIRQSAYFLLAYWQWVLKKCGIEVRDFYVIHCDQQYQRGKTLDPHLLCKRVHVTDTVARAFANIEGIISTLSFVMKHRQKPDIDIGSHCSFPKPCPMMESCWKHLPSPSVFDIFGLPRKTKLSMYRRGLESMKEAFDTLTPNSIQKKQFDAEFNNVSFINKPGLKTFISSVRYPLHFIDFEAVQFCIPRYSGTSAFQQIPFQFSLHFMTSPESDLKHVDFIAPTGRDPRRMFAETLCTHVKKTGSFFAFNAAFERQVLSELSEKFPELASSLMSIHSRIIDISLPFNRMDYYIKEMGGKRSLKSLFHALVDATPYSSLPIMNGKSASDTYIYLHAIKDVDEKNRILGDLQRYCHMDTLALVRLWQDICVASLPD